MRDRFFEEGPAFRKAFLRFTICRPHCIVAVLRTGTSPANWGPHGAARVGVVDRPSRTRSKSGKEELMCRNIKTLHNFKPPATEEEIRASAIQFVRKLSGFNKPSKSNEAAFNTAVDEVTRTAIKLLDSLVTTAPPRNREVEAAKARARTALRFRGAPAV